MHKQFSTSFCSASLVFPPGDLFGTTVSNRQSVSNPDFHGSLRAPFPDLWEEPVDVLGHFGKLIVSSNDPNPVHRSTLTNIKTRAHDVRKGRQTVPKRSSVGKTREAGQKLGRKLFMHCTKNPNFESSFPIEGGPRRPSGF